jgi:hypothetical protein
VAFVRCDSGACSAPPKLAPSLDDGFFFVNWRVFLVSEKIEVRYILEVTEVKCIPEVLFPNRRASFNSTPGAIVCLSRSGRSCRKENPAAVHFTFFQV